VKPYKYIDEKFKSVDKALKLQAKEYERRLNDLNGEAGRLRSMQQTYMPREVFETVMRDMENRIEVLMAFKLKTEGVRGMAGAIPWIISLIGLFLMYYLKE
jgi:hypothetical protein